MVDSNSKDPIKGARPIYEHGPVITELESITRTCHDKIIDISANLDDTTARLDAEEKDLASLRQELDDDHDTITKHGVTLDFVNRRQEAVLTQLAEAQLKLEGLNTKFSNSLDIGSRLEALERSSAVEVSEGKFFTQKNINTILSLLVVSLIGIVLTITWYAIH